MRNDKNPFANIDWVIVALYGVMVLLGWVNIYAAVYNDEFASIFDMSQKYGKQFLWILTSLVLILLIVIVDGKFFKTFAYGLYGLMMAALLGVLFFGKEIAGARSWYAFGGFSLQPSEFAKFTTALALSAFLSGMNPSLATWRDKVYALGIIALPMILIVPQPDPGSALVFTALFLVLYREGLSGNYLVIGVSAAVLFLLALLIDQWWLSGLLLAAGLAFIYITRRTKRAWIFISLLTIGAIGFTQSVDYAFENILEDRHRNRINILLGKMEDPQGVGYNTEQSKIAIGSGGFWGKGFLNGTQTKYDFVPEQSTDFIFCTVGEEWGFIGSFVVVVLFVALILRVVFIAERQRSHFSRIYGYSVASILFIHFAINIAMTIGLAPVIGIPLPFFSYGGSSLWGFTILLFIFVKLDAYRMTILR
ncbi:MAG: rod shape-determining protein RodA [Flavobacteriales bacterium]|nr:rod shape-determining protein RodA [Flavobacteriales bacterium]